MKWLKRSEFYSPHLHYSEWLVTEGANEHGSFPYDTVIREVYSDDSLSEFYVSTGIIHRDDDGSTTNPFFKVDFVSPPDEYILSTGDTPSEHRYHQVVHPIFFTRHDTLIATELWHNTEWKATSFVDKKMYVKQFHAHRNETYEQAMEYYEQQIESMKDYADRMERT